MSWVKDRIRASVFAAGWLCALPVVAGAGTPVTYTDGDTPLFQIEAPDFWNVRTGGLRDLSLPEQEGFRDVSRVLGLSPVAHDGIWVGFIAPHRVGTFDQAREYLQDIGKFLVQDAQVNPEKTRKVGGLSAKTFSGTGARAGKALEFTAITIDMPNNRMAIAVVIFEQGSDGDVVNDINAMLSSFKVAR